MYMVENGNDFLISNQHKIVKLKKNAGTFPLVQIPIDLNVGLSLLIFKKHSISKTQKYFLI